jgi:CheY-like chemotaxis protein
MVRIGENKFNIAGRPLQGRRINAFLNNHSIGAKMFLRVEIGSGVGQALKNPKILIVDDDFALLKSYVENFEFAFPKSERLEASDGHEALEKLNKIIPGSLNIALLDTYMGAISGFEVAEKIREKHPSAYIILKSSNVGETHRQYAEKRIVDIVFDTNKLCWTLEKEHFISSFDEVMATAVRIANERSCAANK